EPLTSSLRNLGGGNLSTHRGLRRTGDHTRKGGLMRHWRSTSPVGESMASQNLWRHARRRGGGHPPDLQCERCIKTSLRGIIERLAHVSYRERRYATVLH